MIIGTSLLDYAYITARLFINRVRTYYAHHGYYLKKKKNVLTLQMYIRQMKCIMFWRGVKRIKVTGIVTLPLAKGSWHLYEFE